MRGRLLQENIGGGVSLFGYTNANKLESFTQNGKRIQRTYDPVTGRLINIEDLDTGDFAEIAYQPGKDWVQTLTLPNGVSRTYGRDDAGRITSMIQNVNAAAETTRFTYNSEQKLQTVTGEDYLAAYYYDSHGRLIHELRTGKDAYIRTYAYDQSDNRVSKKVTDGPGGAPAHFELTDWFENFNTGMPANGTVVSGQWRGAPGAGGSHATPGTGGGGGGQPTVER